LASTEDVGEAKSFLNLLFVNAFKANTFAPLNNFYLNKDNFLKDKPILTNSEAL
jgi:hypothetical protein